MPSNFSGRSGTVIGSDYPVPRVVPVTLLEGPDYPFWLVIISPLLLSAIRNVEEENPKTIIRFKTVGN